MPLPLPSRDPDPLPAGLYSTDAFHRRPLFAVEPAPGQPEQPARVVRSWEEAHALHGPASLSDVNPAYVAALISGDKNADVAPYRRIHRLPRAHQVLIGRDGRVHSSAYDPLAGGAAAMEAHTLHQFLRQGLLDHVQRALQGHAGAIACEHSSGLDSNAVLGALVHGVGMAPERLHTWSNEGCGEGELLQEFRPFYGLLQQQCHRLTDVDEWQETADELLAGQLKVFGAPTQIGSNAAAVRTLREQGCTLLFSGFGGDQALSHNAANVPTDLVAERRWAELVQWMGGRRAALKTGTARALALLTRSWAEQRVRRSTRGFRSSDLLERSLNADGRNWLGSHLRMAYPWELDGYLPQHQSIRQRVLADWVAVRAEEETRIAAAHGMAKAFPLLDETLIATLLQQDPALFGESAGRGRRLHRQAFAPFLPPPLRDNPSKVRMPGEEFGQLQSQRADRSRGEIERVMASSSTWHPALTRHWDLQVMHREVERNLSSTAPLPLEVIRTSQALARMDRLSRWWQSLDD